MAASIILVGYASAKRLMGLRAQLSITETVWIIESGPAQVDLFPTAPRNNWPRKLLTLGDSGQKYIERTRGTAGINAEPSCRRQAIFGTLATTRFAQNPRKIPNAVHICQLITRAPRIAAGEFSAA